MDRRRGKLNLVFFYIHRYLRMTPLMMALIAFCATLLRYTGEGPGWRDSIVMYDGWCKDNWWINSLYLHNFINTNNMVRQTWLTFVSYPTNPILNFFFIDCRRTVP